jgi:hypothetical protein
MAIFILTGHPPRFKAQNILKATIYFCVLTKMLFYQPATH